ncbi:Fc.00g012580.m01.CDS01 [Cosmosporella sp. VM-42]
MYVKKRNYRGPRIQDSRPYLNVASEHLSLERPSKATDPLHISEPYFTPEEAALTKQAIVDNDGDVHQHTFHPKGDDYPAERHNLRGDTFESAVHTQLANSLDKRRAGGDNRPWKPLDMAPIYKQVFGIHLVELKNEKFRRRLRSLCLKVGLDEGAILE